MALFARDREKSNAYQRAWAAANREKVREIKRRSQAKHRDKRNGAKRIKTAEETAKRKEYKRRWEEKNPELVRVAAIRKSLRAKQKSIGSSFRCNYDITLEQFLAVDAAQGCACMICGAQESVGRSKRLYVDHDHVTGKVRGLLCCRCNSALGYLGDNPETVRRAAIYLEGFRVETNNPDWLGRVRSVLGLLSKKDRKKGGAARMAETQAVLWLASPDHERLGLAVPAGAVVEGIRPARHDVA